MNPQKIGIIGGAGPWASAYAVQKIIEYAQWDYKAVQDNEYPEIILKSLHFPGLTENGITKEENNFQILEKTIQGFEKENIKIGLIACNSLHTYFEKHECNTINFIHLPQEGAKTCYKLKHKKVAVLASDYSIKQNIHKKELNKLNIECVSLSGEEQQIVNNLILAVMQGNTGTKEASQFRSLTKTLQNKGATALLTGCTELSYIAHKYQTQIPHIDCLIESINTTLKQSYSK